MLKLVDRKDDNSGKTDMDDIFTFMLKAGEANMILNLPTFVTANLDRISMVHTEDVDICMLARKVAGLEVTVACCAATGTTGTYKHWI